MTPTRLSIDMCGLPEVRQAPFSAFDTYKIACYQESENYDVYRCDDGHAAARMVMTQTGLRCPVCGITQDWVAETIFRLMERKSVNAR